MNTIKEQTIGELVAKDYRAATVFEAFGIDFCCKGNRSIEEACDKKKINSAEVKSALDKIFAVKKEGDIDFKSWPMDLLADYIEKKHHRYVQERIPLLSQYLDKLCKVHGDSHPELFKIRDEFKESATELTAHMGKEEDILFPYIRQMVNFEMAGTAIDPPYFGTVKNPISMMMDEHEAEGDRFERIVELTSGYTPPTDACNTYRVTYQLLEEFEKDLHKHIHLENNILFPAAIEIEANET
ncbi:iron-sulfur cluster repair di-iron protein [Marivirga sp. S37H4]|uniref:Iron-sulfur cluster repair di-iron protein n=1 Tax=Marivirga aurantiaca TaxID=2802615 RepID=A0A934WY26_9BACT|nr:iron-sulfur cluster repair di-iron protein [Marivirga aurantiaca]MBK6264945.1 iron-sulfur cluster repair di-iron protein [Marivirga aurantiaca]